MNPRPPEVFFVTRPPKGGGALRSPPWFSIQNAWYSYICYQCIGMDLLYPLIPKWVQLNFIWRHYDVKISVPSEIWMHWKYTWKLAKINFSLRIFCWICKEMMILIYIKVWSIYLVKYLRNGQNKSHNISPPQFSLMIPPHTQTTPPNVTSYTSKDA